MCCLLCCHVCVHEREKAKWQFIYIQARFPSRPGSMASHPLQVDRPRSTGKFPGRPGRLSSGRPASGRPASGRQRLVLAWNSMVLPFVRAPIRTLVASRNFYQTYDRVVWGQTVFFPVDREGFIMELLFYRSHGYRAPCNICNFLRNFVRAFSVCFLPGRPGCVLMSSHVYHDHGFSSITA